MRPRLLSLLLCFAPLPLLIAPGACGHNGSPQSPAGCSRPTESTDDAGHAPAPAISSGVAVVPDAGLPHVIDRGCMHDLSPSLSASAQLDTAGRMCAPSMSVVLAPKGYGAAPDQSASARLELARHACVRIGMATEPSGLAVQSRLNGPDGSPVGTWRSITPLLIGEHGPICVRDAGSYTLQALPNASATVWIAAWGAEATAP